jgi:hypothetical protein
VILPASCVVAFTLIPALTPAQAPPPALSEEVQVTSVDLWVGGVRDRFGTWLRGEGSLPELEPDQLELRVDGRVTKIVGVATATGEPAPTRIVVFFDAPTSDQAAFRWAASRLGEHAARLTALGEVEVVVADPEPRVAIAATRDSTRLAEVFAGLALFAGTEAEIPLLRDEFLASNEEPDEEPDAELAARFVEEETALVVHRQDLLLRHLIEPEPATRAGRVLIYVSQGFDPRPGDFYFEESGGSKPEPETLESETRAWVEALAAHGWTCLPLVYEDRRAVLRRGFRIGKARLFFRPGIAGKGPGLTVGAAFEEERDPETAEALVELGDGALGRGDQASAAAAYLRAIHHFYGDPRTQERQAYAWGQLALALRGSGEADRARQAMANAIELDPALASAADGALSDLAPSSSDAAGLGELAVETGGSVLRDGESLTSALEVIARRQRLTFTLEDAASGRVLPLELSKRGGERVPLGYARWVRSGTPERVSMARLRVFLDQAAVEPMEDGDLVLKLMKGKGAGDSTEAEAGDSIDVTIAIERLDSARATRVAIGLLDEQGSQRTATLDPGPGSAALWRGKIDLPGDEILAAALYVEDLARGEWTVEPVSIDSAADARGAEDVER